MIFASFFSSGCQKDYTTENLILALESVEVRQALKSWVELTFSEQSSDLASHLTRQKYGQPGDFVINLEFDWSILNLPESTSNQMKLFGSAENPEAIGFYFGSRDYLIFTILDKDSFSAKYSYLLKKSTWVGDRICVVCRPKGF